MDPDSGWYPDQLDPTLERFFDGKAWTDVTRPVSVDAETLSDVDPDEDNETWRDDNEDVESAGDRRRRLVRAARPLFVAGAALALGAVVIVVGVNLSTVNKPQGSANEATGCTTAMAVAAAIPIDEDANTELLATASACGSVAEWATAARAYPAAMGQTDSAVIDPKYDLSGICGLARQTPVCQDAISKGLNTYW